ncbi:MAG: NAD(P)H-dependent oxidoreductase [Armatimonadota bacterium]|nr:MAG: NAD(P)H-dependent oxidoreductase [Armatimonadota bacterium]
MAVIGVFYFSSGGNTEAMARAVAEGCESAGAQVTVQRVEETDPKKWTELDAVILGSPTYFGNMAWQAKKLVDDSIAVYQHLRDKVGGVFTSTGGRRDGERALQALTWALDIHGMKVVDGGPVCEGQPSADDIEACRAYGKRVAEAC